MNEKEKFYALVNEHGDIQGCPQASVYKHKKSAEAEADYWNKTLWKGSSKVVEVRISIKKITK